SVHRPDSLGEQQVRFIPPPPVSESEIDWDGIAVAKQLGHPGLVAPGECRDRTEIVAERLEPPFFWVEINERNTGVVLKDRRAVVEKEVSYRREAAAVHEVGRTLD